MIKKENIINLTDIGNHNPVRARRLPYGQRLPDGVKGEDISINSNDPDIISYSIPGLNVRPDKKKQSTYRSNGLMRSASDPSSSSTDVNNNVAFVCSLEDKDPVHHDLGPELIDPDGNYDEYLEATGATIIKSEIYFPASKTTITNVQ